MKKDIKGRVRILSFMKNDIKVFSAIYGDNWQSLNILTTGETFAQNITGVNILQPLISVISCYIVAAKLAVTYTVIFCAKVSPVVMILRDCQLSP